MSNQIVPFKENYNLLQLAPEEDVEKIRQFARASNERKILLRRAQEIEDILRENSSLSMWTTTKSNGEVAATADLTEEELANAIAYSSDKYLLAEARSREAVKLIEGEESENE